MLLAMGTGGGAYPGGMCGIMSASPIAATIAGVADPYTTPGGAPSFLVSAFPTSTTVNRDFYNNLPLQYVTTQSPPPAPPPPSPAPPGTAGSARPPSLAALLTAAAAVAAVLLATERLAPSL